MGNFRVRKKQIKIYLLDEEISVLKDKTLKYGMNQSDFIRSLILYGNPVIVDRMKDVDIKNLAYELNRIGNNVNQIAYQANSKCAVSKTDFDSLKEEYDRLLNLYLNEVMNR